MFAGIFSCTPSFSPEINKVYLILSYYKTSRPQNCRYFTEIMELNGAEPDQELTDPLAVTWTNWWSNPSRKRWRRKGKLHTQVS